MGQSAGMRSVPFNLKFLAARVLVYVRQLADGRVFAAVCGQPVFEVGVVGADEDGGVFLVKKEKS